MTSFSINVMCNVLLVAASVIAIYFARAADGHLRRLQFTLGDLVLKMRELAILARKIYKDRPPSS